VGQLAWRLGITPQRYRALEASEVAPDFETWDRICKLYGWPETFYLVARDLGRRPRFGFRP
jgi:hypothetical protein